MIKWLNVISIIGAIIIFFKSLFIGSYTGFYPSLNIVYIPYYLGTNQSVVAFYPPGGH